MDVSENGRDSDAGRRAVRSGELKKSWTKTAHRTAHANTHNCPHDEVKLKQTSFKTVLKLF